MKADIPFSRRTFLAATTAASGLSLRSKLALATSLHGGHPLAPKPSHFPAKAKRLIVFFMTGGISHIDTFDHKPQLNRRHDQQYGKRKLKGCQFTFKPYGECGHFISELLPHVGRVADDICFIHSLYNDSGGHSKATLAMRAISASS